MKRINDHISTVCLTITDNDDCTTIVTSSAAAHIRHAVNILIVGHEHMRCWGYNTHSSMFTPINRLMNCIYVAIER